VAVVAGHGIDERQRLDGEAEPDELLAQSLESVELVTQHGGPLEVELVARLLHVRAEQLHRRIVGAVEECAHQRDPLIVLPRRTSTDAWAEALPDLVADASWRAREDLEQLWLIGEVHRLIDPA